MARTTEELVECESCKRKHGEVNHPPGMIFIGWGRGWERCPTCNGTQKVPKGTSPVPVRCCERDTDGDEQEDCRAVSSKEAKK